MSLEARRKARLTDGSATPPAPTTAAATTTSQAPNGPRKTILPVSRLTGPARSIELARAYTQQQPLLGEDNLPISKAYFGGTEPKALDKGSPPAAKRVVNNSTFSEHTNATVIKAIFGVPLKPRIVRMILDGISDQILQLVDAGFDVKLPNLVKFSKKYRQARLARNPRENTTVRVPAGDTIVAKPAKAAKLYINRATSGS